jgi:hypothetical protein
MVLGGIIIGILSSFLSVNAHGSVERVVKPQNYILCKNKSTVRTIRVESSEEGCEAKYTKAGVDQVIGHGSHEAACQKFVNNVKVNLEGANWQCREVKDSKITAESAETND